MFVATIENDICKIYATTVEIERVRSKPYKDVRDIILQQFQHTDNYLIPLIFLNKRMYYQLLFAEARDFEPHIEVITEIISEYICIKHLVDGGSTSIYIIRNENNAIYTIRGFLEYHSNSFAPNDIDTEKLKQFITGSCIPFYRQNGKFSHPLYIE